MAPLISNDAVVLGLLMATLGVIFWTEQHPKFRSFYRYVPALLLCYFVPALYNTFGIIDGERSGLYFVASRYLLPTTLVLLTLAIDLPAVMRLGPKALLLFISGTVGVVIGGPIAMLIWQTIAPESVGPDIWRGLTAVAGSWIGGSANQVAMKEVFQIPDNLFGAMIAVDVLVANVWMAILLWMAANNERLDAKRGADTSAIRDLRRRLEHFAATHQRMPRLPDVMFIAAIGFGITGLSHGFAQPLVRFFEGNVLAERLSLTSDFFWIVVLATTFGLLLSFTRARKLEGAGASRIGSALLYVMIASVGMRMDIKAVFEIPALFGLGLTWIAIHAGILLLVARIVRAPAFFVAVGSQANIGGAASAPVVAAAFHPSLAPVGVLLAVVGYALGTYAGWLCGQLMRVLAGQ